ncbi:hypothetical protein HanXRQr2_Chr08g0336841 [Helianthus annuus]|uniref:Uncharacterized protein n=1 Tax=Helianthus annuus TaxID=4232 RepID=A0A251SW86_HELAN|nr:hypothetical protein HanXRQr2_Chr08g0336841 [Helianthus annuus]KAJ0901448.1 hypothetical protein HanPSC8_Chr08g0325431 [Helianthus annuus]
MEFYTTRAFKGLNGTIFYFDSRFKANTWVEGDLVPEVAMVVVAVEEIFQQVFLVCNLRLDWCS